MIEASLSAELSHHLGYAPGAVRPEAASNHHTGVTARAVLTGGGKVRIAMPRERDGTFPSMPVLPPGPYDNAKAEGFMKTLTIEAVYLAVNVTFEDVTADLRRFID